MKRGLLNKIFEIRQSTASHISFSLLGIRFNFMKPSLKAKQEKLSQYYHSFKNASDIPPAEGALRLVQKANTSLLKIFTDICKENNIEYWIDFGTLLGAVRHKGFIPWDDDIDIGMTRENYNRFIEIFSNEIKNHPDLVLYFENNKKNKCFAKVKHKDSNNMFIDVFPYDFYNSKLSDEGKKILSEKIVAKRKPRLKRKSNTVEVMQEYFSRITRENILENKEVDLNIEPAIFMGIDFPHAWKNKVYDYETIFPIGKISFEGIEFPAPNMPEKVLESIYGDYMRIPKDSYPRHTSYLDIKEPEKSLLESITK